VLSEKTTSDPSPHVMLIEDAGVTFVAKDLEEVPEKSMIVALKLTTKRVIAIATFMRLVSLQKPKL
jgi:hypothetical protein